MLSVMRDVDGLQFAHDPPVWPRRVLAGRRAHAGVSMVVAGISVVVLAGCAAGGPEVTVGAPSAASVVGPVDPDRFAVVVAEPDRVTVNVHVPFDGDIAGTDLAIPFDHIAAEAGRLPADRGAGLAIYCRSGPMSAVAAEILRDLGYTNVVELRGGMRAWQASGRPLLGI